MAIAETAAVASIISKLLSMSTDLIERHKSSEILTEIREIQKLTMQLQSLYVAIEAKNSELQSKIIDFQTDKSKLEHSILDKEREQHEILKRLDEWDQYDRKTSSKGFVYYKHKSELKVYACAICKSKEPYPVVLQPWKEYSTTHKCRICSTRVTIED